MRALNFIAVASLRGAETSWSRVSRSGPWRRLERASEASPASENVSGVVYSASTKKKCNYHSASTAKHMPGGEDGFCRRNIVNAVIPPPGYITVVFPTNPRDDRDSTVGEP